MSDRSRPSDPDVDGRPASRGGPGPAIAAAAVVLAVLVTSLFLLRERDRQAEPVPTPATVTPISTPTTPEASPSPATPDQTESPSPSPSPSPTGDATAEPSPTGAQDPEEVAEAFTGEYVPEGGEQVISRVADVTGDGDLEVVFASIVGDSVRIDVARWNGRFYEISFVEYGAPAEQLESLEVSDYTGDGRRLEIVTQQSSGEQGESLSIWGWDGARFAAQAAEDGCWDGSNTFGVVGATIAEGRIEATCDGSPLPTAAWPTDIYLWDGRSWVYEASRIP